MQTLPEIHAALIAGHQSFVDYVLDLDESRLLTSPQEKWTPAQHYDHIRRAVGPVVLAFSLPKWLLKRMFGLSNRPSRSYEALVARYHEKLAAGGKASGTFIPNDVSAASRRRNTLQINAYVARLVKVSGRFSEEELDQYLLPHPILGKLSLREMLFFTAYHASHHERIVRQYFERIA